MLALSTAVSLAPSAAASQSDTLRLSRSAARERALVRSSELAHRAGVRRQSDALARVPYASNPEVSVEFEGVGGPWARDEFTRRVSLEQEIDLRGESRALRRSGAVARMLAEREFDEAVQWVRAAVDEAYSRHLVASRQAALLAPLRDRARSLRAKAEGARQRETLTGFEARQLRAEALSLEADWLEARRELETSEAELRAWLELHPDSVLVLENDLDERHWSCQLESAWMLARQGRATLARAAAAESLASARLALEERRGRVNPTLGVSLARERSELEVEAGPAIGSEETRVGVEARVPLPIFGLNQTAVSEARVELQRIRAERAALEREVRQEVAAACIALERLEEERQLRTEAASSAERDLRSIEAAYEDGRIPLEEYLTLRERLVRQQLDVLEVLRRLEEERGRLARATGAPREDLAGRWGGR